MAYFVGYIAGRQNTTGHANTFIGYGAGYNNSSGFSNVMLGYRAGRNNVSGDNNVMVGDSAGFNNQGNKNLFLGKRAGFYETGSNKLYLAADSNQTIMYGDLSTGQLLLGKPQPKGYVFAGNRTLNVLGGVLADSIRVSLSSKWADYVFDEEYKLPALEEVEGFIKINKHLPGIPPAREVRENGLDLGTINAKLLEKIEELTLYVLELKREIEGLKKR